MTYIAFLSQTSLLRQFWYQFWLINRDDQFIGVRGTVWTRLLVRTTAADGWVGNPSKITLIDSGRYFGNIGSNLLQFILIWFKNFGIIFSGVCEIFVANSQLEP